MAQQLTIKQIAALAGVSAGTVDRVLHNRGKVSEEALAAVRAVLDTQNYKYNLHSSAIAFKKTGKVWNIVISIPFSKEGEYWDLVKSGIDKALGEYSDFSLNIEYVLFDQFDANDCHKAFAKIKKMDCSAAIIGTTFVDETKALCKKLDKNNVPYIFVDGKVEETKPIATFMADQTACGRLLARLMDGLTPDGKELALLLPRRIGADLSNNSTIRMQAFKSFFEENKRKRIIREGHFSVEESGQDIRSFLAENPKVGGVAVVISTGYIVSDAVAGPSRQLVIGGFDVTKGNARCVREGNLDFLIDQNPEKQGFYAVESMLHYLLYGAPDMSLPALLPIGVIFKENLPE